MTLVELNNAIKLAVWDIDGQIQKLEIEKSQTIHKLRFDYAVTSSKFKVGDYIRDHRGSILKVMLISYAYNPMFDRLDITYIGERFHKVKNEFVPNKRLVKPTRPFYENNCKLITLN